ncbi:MAG: hypothetical protein H0T62_10340 [Parachlamydiaceae bacterium]|nr:hypothetical protein [Parachlamydiaceae bacterium]
MEINKQDNEKRAEIPLSWDLARKEGIAKRRGTFEKILLMVSQILLGLFFTFVIPLIPLILVWSFLGGLIERFMIHFGLNKILVAVRKMKDVEEKNKFQAMKDVLAASPVSPSGPVLINSMDIEKYFFSLPLDHLKKMNVSESQIKEFKRLFIGLIEILLDSKGLQQTYPSKANKQFVKLFRKLLTHPLYRLYKRDESCPFVALLHDFAVAIPNGTHAMGAYKQMGKAIISAGNITVSNSDPEGIEGKALAEKLELSQAAVVANHYYNEDLFSTLVYGVMHLRHALGSFASQGGKFRLFSALFGLDEYDSHGTLSNNPSLQGKSKWGKFGEKINGIVNHCYGGSPTIGDHRIAPEFKALLQAAENNYFSKPELRRKGVPSKIIYHSLQNIDMLTSEGPRSRALMHLNQVYPHSFIGTILSKDTWFSHIKHPEHIVWENPKQFSRLMKEKFMEGVHFPENKDHGFYFHGSPKRWELIFDTIFEALSKQPVFVATDRVSEREREKLQNAYLEYVYALLIAVIECQTIKELNDAGIEDPIIMEMIVCRENIDRGGMENLKSMYLRLSLIPDGGNQLSDEDKLECLVGAMNSRALSARDRAILKVRMRAVLAFIEKVRPQEFNQTLEVVLSNLELEARLTYAPDL